MLIISLKKTIKLLHDKDYEELACLLEETWKHHPSERTDDYDLWREQLAVNIPVLYLASICLHRFVIKNGVKNLLFATRDCAHWHKIYKAMYPNESVHYFTCSRNMFNIAREQSRPHYEKYINDLTGGDIEHSVYIDIHGTGKRMYDFFDEKYDKIPTCFILSSGHSDCDGLPKGIRKMVKNGKADFLIYGADGSPIEMLNYDIIGTCHDFNKNGAVRGDVEYDIKHIKGYHDCVKTFIKILKKRSRLDSDHDKNSLIKMIRYLFKPALNDMPYIANWIKPERKHLTSPI